MGESIPQSSFCPISYCLNVNLFFFYRAKLILVLKVINYNWGKLHNDSFPCVLCQDVQVSVPLEAVISLAHLYSNSSDTWLVIIFFYLYSWQPKVSCPANPYQWCWKEQVRWLKTCSGVRIVWYWRPRGSCQILYPLSSFSTKILELCGSK